MSNAIVAGVDMVKFAKPGQQEPYRGYGFESDPGCLERCWVLKPLRYSRLTAVIFMVIPRVLSTHCIRCVYDRHPRQLM